MGMEHKKWRNEFRRQGNGRNKCDMGLLKVY
jgi:hypothetical protein